MQFAGCIVGGTCHSWAPQCLFMSLHGADVAPEGTDGLSCLSVFQLKVFPCNHQVYRDVRAHIHIHRFTITA